MKSSSILYLVFVLVLSGAAFAESNASRSSNSDDRIGFPSPGPVTNANPFIRVPVSIHVPTQLKIERTTDTLSIQVDNQKFLAKTNLTVGTNMITGVQSIIYIYPEDEPNKTTDHDKWSMGLSSGLDFNLGTQYLHQKPNGIPAPGKSYIVRVDLTAFETDIPLAHDWIPHSKNYKILWHGTLTQLVK